MTVKTREDVVATVAFYALWPSPITEPEVILDLCQQAQDAGAADMRQRAATAVDPTGVLGLAATILALPLQAGLL